MAHAENTVTIARPPATIFAFLLDGANNPRWRPAVLSITKEPGSPAGVGAIYRQQLQGPGGRPIAGDYEITVCEPDETLAFRVIAGPARPTGVYHLSRSGEGTTVRFILDAQPTGLARLMDPIITSTMKGEVAMLDKLKAYLESQPAQA